ncbi:MAG: hypothetical protein V3T30_08400, partial [Thermodesulfobacteriota bacterium]
MERNQLLNDLRELELELTTPTAIALMQDEPENVRQEFGDTLHEIGLKINELQNAQLADLVTALEANSAELTQGMNELKETI